MTDDWNGCDYCDRKSCSGYPDYSKCGGPDDSAPWGGEPE